MDASVFVCLIMTQLQILMSRAVQTSSNEIEVFTYVDDREFLRISSKQSHIIEWMFLIDEINVIFMKLQLRKSNTTFEISELGDHGKSLSVKNHTLSHIVQSFTFNKLILQRVTKDIDGHDIVICAIHRVGNKKLKEYCNKYATFKIERIIYL
ncbi:hypothetical protein RF11_08733 [Thelohanellus kitauei]|uniref:Reverse transcriptase domain-containing protein n=1 Tax=Thelohanellus kitauei TaxID=669202 RepID=A0A0C2JAC1_THEKT|nr:hypothetical protein RF11_08733 [Thelohanellus kitauei]